MRVIAIVLCLGFLYPAAYTQSISSSQKKQLARMANAKNAQFQKALSAADRKTLARMQITADSVARLAPGRSKTMAIQNFNRKYAGFRSKIIKNARFDQNAYLTDIQRALPQYKFQKSAKGLVAMKKSVLQKYSPKVNRNTSFDRVVRAKPVSQKTGSKSGKSPAVFPANQLSERFERSSCSGGAYQGSFQGGTEFSSFATASLASGCETKRALGANVNVPSGVQNVRVRITLDGGFTLSTNALGALGYGHCQTEVGIRIKGPGVDKYYKDSDLISVAPVMYFSEVDYTESGTYVMETTFRPQSSGGTYRVQAYGKTFSMGIAGGMGVGYTHVDGVGKVEVFFE
ncbi:MAG: hypothetical protein DWQ02_15220 [Bacteroidetes bacterium]|nr:MAG: hypothetical protein DWQ02_15220 [Bacteroidota bacterium]